jgi:hypothetical protein
MASTTIEATKDKASISNPAMTNTVTITVFPVPITVLLVRQILSYAQVGFLEDLHYPTSGWEVSG